MKTELETLGARAYYIVSSPIDLFSFLLVGVWFAAVCIPPGIMIFQRASIQFSSF